ncbi:unnamed protein product [Adineta ricciae]|uniref:Uncharacterized protein n=1 Tax=Adineta ricciae TaxID=249248 RepID=A0A813UTC1_ADIRI|nr:unnamed protein product [Adineta ricciae]
MSRHVDDIKTILFDEPDFDSDEEVKSKNARRKEKKKLKTQTEVKKKPQVETIVFRDPAKRKKLMNKPTAPISTPDNVEFDLEKARFDVHKFGIKGFEKSKYEDARVALAVSLGAKPPKQKFINYRELIEQNRAKKQKEKEDEENARLLGDLFHKNPNSSKKPFQRAKQKRIGEGDVGSMRFSSVGKFQGGVLKLSEKEISKIEILTISDRMILGGIMIKQLMKQHLHRLYSSQTNSPYIVYGSQKTADLFHKQPSSLRVVNDYLTDDEYNNLLKEVDGFMKRKRYEYSHWDGAIHGYREAEKTEWTQENQQVLSRIRQFAFDDPTQTLVHVHVLDIAKDGYIKPHIDAIRYCGTTIAGLSFLSTSVMRLVHKDDKSMTVDLLLKPKSLYILKDFARFDFTHEILKNEQSYFNNVHIPRNRRISIMCRNLPLDPTAG